jgi:hypothetical protein
VLEKSSAPGSWPRTSTGAEGRALARRGRRGRGGAGAAAHETHTHHVAGATVPAPLARYEVPAATSRARVTATAAPCARVGVSGVALPVRLSALAGAVARWCPLTAPGTLRPRWAAAGDAAVTRRESVREKESCAPAECSIKCLKGLTHPVQ